MQLDIKLNNRQTIAMFNMECTYTNRRQINRQELFDEFVSRNQFRKNVLLFSKE